MNDIALQLCLWGELNLTKCLTMDMLVILYVTVYIQPQSRLPGFFIGCLLGLAWFYHGRRLERAVRDMRKTNILRW